jgi:hypothetical protein
VLAPDPAQPAAERQPGQAGLGHDARRRRQAELLRRAIELAQQHSGLDARGARSRLDADALPPGEVDDHAVVAHRVAGHVVTASAHGEREVALAGEAQGGDDVLGAGAAREHRRPAVDHVVPDPPRRLVPLVARTHQLAGERRAQLVQHRRTSIDRHPTDANRTGARGPTFHRSCKRDSRGETVD